MTNHELALLFGENLKKLIEKSGKQQKDIAFDLDIPITTMNNWCVGKVIPRYGKLQMLADYFGCTISELTDDKQSTSLDVEKALKLYERYQNAIPQVRDAVEALLKPAQSDS